MDLAWLTSFVWTLAIELPIYALVLANRFPRWWGPVALTLVANLVTHPALWVSVSRAGGGWAAIVMGEIAVVIVETLVAAVAVRNWRAGLLAATVANALSFAGGALVWRAIRYEAMVDRGAPVGAIGRQSGT